MASLPTTFMVSFASSDQRVPGCHRVLYATFLAIFCLHSHEHQIVEHSISSLGLR